MAKKLDRVLVIIDGQEQQIALDRLEIALKFTDGDKYEEVDLWVEGFLGDTKEEFFQSIRSWTEDPQQEG